MEMLILILFGLPISYFDLRQKRLPLPLTLSALSASIIYRFVQYSDFREFALYIMAGAAGFLFVFAIRIITKGGIGLGDALVSAFLGIILGLKSLLPAILLAAVLALVISLLLLGLKKIDRATPIPFAPFLYTGGVLTLIIMAF
ncbi:MAG: prepilin peptidase [Spirochaetales bacterium]|nr:prepilin peptidase [Spirochaetales bacterium]